MPMSSGGPLLQPFCDAVPVPLLLCTYGGVIRYANAPARNLLGDPLPGGCLTDFLSPADGEVLPETPAGIPTAHKLQLQGRDGERRTVHLDVRRVADREGDFWLVTLQDVSSCCMHEQRLERSLDFAGIGAWDWDIGSGDLYWSERIAPLFGYAHGELETTYDNFLAAVHPDDRAEVEAAVRACLDTGREYDLEHRVVWPDGSVHWVLERGDAVRDDRGKPLRMLGVVQDITLRKHQESVLELAAKVIEHTPEGVLITDSDLRILAVNPAFTRTTGYAAEDVCGRKPSILSSGRHGQKFYAAMWAALRETGQWQGEIWNRRKNGDIYPEWLNISAICGPGGETTHYAAIFSDLSTQEHVRHRLHRLAYYDPVTDLPNRDLFRDRLASALARTHRKRGRVALIFLDLDRFKTVNDSLGHSSGDGLLKAVGKRFQETLGESDTVSRFGGDEFAVVLTDIDTPEDAARAARRLIDSLSRPLLVDGHEIFISASIGISIHPDDGNAPEELTRNADTAMYRAKELGRNNYQFYTKSMGERSAGRLVLFSELHKAIGRGELSLAFQPQVSVSTGRIVGVEALARWQNERLGPVSPDLFISAAEEIGIIGELGRWVLREALHHLRQWQLAGFGGISMAVNVSGHQLLGGGLLQEVEAALCDYGIAPRALELELTESVLMENADATMDILSALHRMGISLAVDDFGTGYSSLAYLRRFEIDKLKIDKSFVSDIPHDRGDSEIAATVIAMGQKLGLRVVAEGVETREQLSFLAEQGCHLVQGYFYSPPVSGEALLELLERDRSHTAFVEPA